MKIKLELADIPETEVLIRGDVDSEEVASLLRLLGRRSTGKLLLYKDEEQCIVEEAEIVFLEVRDGRAYVYTKQDTYETKLKLYELKAQLPNSFVQINKSVVVNIHCVKSIQAEFSGNYRLKLKNRKEVLTISRKYFKEFKDSI